MTNTVEGIVCVDCGKVAPSTETPYTLIGPRFSWRLTFAVDAQGKRSQEWRCGTCSRLAKRGKPGTGPPSKS